MCKVQKLTDAEVAVMKILWDAEDGMTIPGDCTVSGAKPVKHSFNRTDCKTSVKERSGQGEWFCTGSQCLCEEICSLL